MSILTRSGLKSLRDTKIADGGGITAQSLRDYEDSLIDSIYNLTDDAIAITAAGTDTYTSTDSFTTSYATGQKYTVIFTNANSTAATLNINGQGAKAIKKSVSTALVSGDILAGQIYSLCYDGTNFQLLSTPTSASMSTFDVTCTGTEISSLNGTPKQLVAAPGSGKYINIIGAVTVKFHYSTAAFATNTNIALILGTSVVSNQLANVINQTVDTYGCFGCVQWTGAATVIENQALKVEVVTGNPTAGNASATLRLIGRYEILTY